MRKIKFLLAMLVVSLFLLFSVKNYFENASAAEKAKNETAKDGGKDGKESKDANSKRSAKNEKSQSAAGPGTKDITTADGAKASNTKDEKVEGKDKGKDEKYCVQVEDVANELEKKRHTLEDRERKVVDLEEKLKFQENILKDKIDRLEKIKSEITAVMENYNKDLDTKRNKMVKVLETMAPKNTAETLEKMDEDYAVKIISKMDSNKVAKILNNMDKKKAATLVEKLNGKGALPAFDIGAE